MYQNVFRPIAAAAARVVAASIETENTKQRGRFRHTAQDQSCSPSPMLQLIISACRYWNQRTIVGERRRRQLKAARKERSHVPHLLMSQQLLHPIFRFESAKLQSSTAVAKLPAYQSSPSAKCIYTYTQHVDNDQRACVQRGVNAYGGAVTE